MQEETTELSLKDTLQSKKVIIERRLAQVNTALEKMESNPEAAELAEALAKFFDWHNDYVSF